MQASAIASKFYYWDILKSVLSLFSAKILSNLSLLYSIAALSKGYLSPPFKTNCCNNEFFASGFGPSL